MSLKLMVATDGSPAAERSLREALKVVKAEGATALVVAVIDVAARIGGNDNANEDVARAITVLEAAGIAASTNVIRSEDIAGAILDAAKAYQPDVLVMGSSGRGNLADLLLGSVTHKVTAHWTGPVLVARAPH